MGSREVPFEENEYCDVCGKKGAFDFMGDLICGDCFRDEDDECEHLHKVTNSRDDYDIVVCLDCGEEGLIFWPGELDEYMENPV